MEREAVLYSMTGYGRASAEREGLLVEVEVKGVNHKYLDVNVRLPRQFTFLEPHIRRFVQEKVARGRVDLYIQIKFEGAKGKKVELNVELAFMLWDKVRELSSELKAPLPHLGSIIREVMIVEESVDEEELLDVVMEAVREAFEQFLSFKKEEGDRLRRDILKRLGRVEEFVEKAFSLAEIAVEETRRKLMERLKELDVDDQRVAQEIAIMIDRMDVTEELVRLKSHIEAFEKTVEKGSPCGRKLDFISQEMLREANTLGVKAATAQLNHLAVDMKTEIEKIREQVQNIE